MLEKVKEREGPRQIFRIKRVELHVLLQPVILTLKELHELMSFFRISGKNSPKIDMGDFAKVALTTPLARNPAAYSRQGRVSLRPLPYPNPRIAVTVEHAQTVALNFGSKLRVQLGP